MPPETGSRIVPSEYEINRMNISFSGTALPKAGCIVILVAADAIESPTVIEMDTLASGQIRRAAKTADFSGKQNAFVDILAPSGTTLDRVVLAGIGNPKELTAWDAERLGGAIAGKLSGMSSAKAHIVADGFEDLALSAAEFAARVASGMVLRTYTFDKYKSKKKKEDLPKLKSVSVYCRERTQAKKIFQALEAVAAGVHIARDFVNEPANELYPVEFARRAKALTKLGVKVDILGEKELKKEKMLALLGVGLGSVRESRVVVMRWDGGKKNDAPLAFVGKGVTFDTGGISLKPGAGMGDMKGDMGGAACVVGLMHALAGRKAKVNAIGVIGLVENMPDAAAQRPGDIVKSMSGQTIEILNTDAEGRLVLADALWYTKERFKPKFMIDLATLTGAILTALGQEHAGLFSNNDALADNLADAGRFTGEKVWRMPLSEEYDKMIDTPIADMKNIGGRYAGSITAAQFLQRFVDDTDWAHLDIAGTAMNSPKNTINQSWGSGYGVRLLNSLVERHYEA